MNHNGPFVYNFTDKFSLNYSEFEKIMCYNSDCVFDGQLFGFKTKQDAEESISNLYKYARGDKNEFN
jgi:hypothetical protein